ncbi:MAG: NUDIX hydrolase [Bacteroidales bacterium]
MPELLDVNRWRNALTSSLPGEEAQELMAPTFRGAFQQVAEPVRAAVMVLIYPQQGKLFTIFIKRNEYDGPHSGQVSFPGGATEKGDNTMEATALRETREELGITEEINILGTLTPLHIPVSNFLVVPVVGWCRTRPSFHPDPAEVQYLIETPIRSLLEPGNIAREKIRRHGKIIDTPFYRAGEEKIWGATAMMLSEFLQLASRLLPLHC